MEIKLIGNGTKEAVIEGIKARLDVLDEVNGKQTKTEMIDLIKSFVAEVREDLERDTVEMAPTFDDSE